MCALSPEELLKLTRDAKKKLRYDKPLDPETDQDLLVDLNAARGEFSQDKLLWELGVDEPTLSLDLENPLQYVLFGGHRGCGKSTELRRLALRLHRPQLYFVVLVDALKELDINNLHYSDILLAQAKVLLDALDGKIDLEPVFLHRLESWFQQRVNTQLTEQQYSGKIQAGVKAKSGIPFLGALFAELTNSISIGSTHKEEIRSIVRNSFSEFAEAFNQLILHVEERLRAGGFGNKILFIVDGTDRLSSDEANDFFIRDIHQLKQIQSNFIYCTPIDILTESGRIGQEFSVFRLPMVKIAEKHATDYLDTPFDCLRELIDKRVDSRLWRDHALLDKLIAISGGHVRDLMRLLDYALAETQGRKAIDDVAVQSAIKHLASDYQRVIKHDDFALLVEIDLADKDHVPVSETTRRLLYDLVLLEYNSYWWQSHPVVRELPAYRRALGG